MDTAQPDVSILERIQKLHAKGVSAREIGSEQEAITFLDAVQKMLDKYDMDMSEVEYKVSLAKDPVTAQFVDSTEFGQEEKRSADAAQRVISHYVCQMFHCTRLNVVGSPRSFWVVGRREHREIARFMCVTILRDMELLAQKAYVAFFYKCRAEGDVTKARGFKEAYRQSFATRIGTRIVEMMVEREVHQTGVGLVRLRTETSMVQAFMDKLKESGDLKEGAVVPVRQIYNSDGVKSGRIDANKINLAGRPVESPTQHKRLGGGG